MSPDTPQVRDRADHTGMRLRIAAALAHLRAATVLGWWPRNAALNA